MAEKKLRYHHGDLPQQVSQLAWEQVRQSGADKLSLRGCARQAGVDPAALYRHFRSKEDLLGHLADRAFSELSQAMQAGAARCPENDPRGALIEIGLAYIRYARAEPHVFRMMFDIAGRATAQGRGNPSGAGEAAHGILTDAILRVDPQARVEVQAFALWSSVHGFAKLVNAGLGPPAAEVETLARAICESAVATIR